MLEEELIASSENDPWMIRILAHVRSLNLNDCWIGAGFVRNKIWDEKHGLSRSNLNDIDVIYFDKINPAPAIDKEIELRLDKLDKTVNWSVKNQARMHIRNGHKPYQNTTEAISYWPETATAVAIRLTNNNKVECIAPHGLHDLFHLIVQPTPGFNLKTYQERIARKQWSKRWNKLVFKQKNM